MDFMKKAINEPLKLNLQFFADGDDNTKDDPPGGSDKGDKGGEDKTPEEIELEKKIEAESDRKLAKALEKKQREWEAKQEEAIQKALEEKERLSKLSEKERKEEELSTREKELQNRLAEIERKELRSDAVSDLSEKGLPTEFADILLGEDAESTLENINKFKTTFDAAVNAKVKEAIRQDTPPAGTGAFNNGKVPSVAEMAQEHRIIK